MNNGRESLVDELLSCNFSLIENLVPHTAVYRELKESAHKEISSVFEEGGKEKGIEVNFGQFGILKFPFFQMGTVDSLNLFDLDELIIFNFYGRNKGRYAKMADMGANLGLHSVIGARCGFSVRAFEPDPVHFHVLQDNIERNGVSDNIIPYNAACSSQDGVMNFCRVKGNTTGSHLTGSKANPYGELEYFDVNVENALNHIVWADIVKMDVEGHEPAILCATDKKMWESTDALVEIQDAKNAELVFEHFQKIGVNLFSQQIGWKKVTDISEMPHGYKDGTLFISSKESMPWN